MKGLIEIHNRVKFHLHSICGCGVMNFQKFCGDGAAINWAILGGVLGPNSHKNTSMLLKLAPEVVLKERNSVLKFLLKIPIFTDTTR